MPDTPDRFRVFLSWSGKRSRAVASALRDWLPDVLQRVEPWMSEEDINKGARWAQEVDLHLAQSRVGIICLTPENRGSEWVLFEAGALSKSAQDTLVCTYLLDLRKADVQPPLSLFQATEAIREDTGRMVAKVNDCLGPGALTTAQLTRAFERCWPDLEHTLARIRSEPAGGNVAVPRSNSDILEEVLALNREIYSQTSQIEYSRYLTQASALRLREVLGSIDRLLETSGETASREARTTLGQLREQVADVVELLDRAAPVTFRSAIRLIPHFSLSDIPMNVRLVKELPTPTDPGPLVDANEGDGSEASRDS
jgi:hypothetical protein